MPERRHDLLERLVEPDSFAGWPANLADSPEGLPEGLMDAFSEILSVVKLNGALFFTAEFSAPWGFSAAAANIMATLCCTTSASTAEHSSS